MPDDSKKSTPLLTMAEIRDKFFNRDKDPLLRAGFVSTDYFATTSQREEAEKLLASRRARFPWKREPLLEEIRQQLLMREIPLPADPIIQRALPFWPQGRLIHFNQHAEGEMPSAQNAQRYVFAKVDGEWLVQKLDGTSPPIHAIRQQVLAAGLMASPDHGVAEEYLDFFCEHVHGDDGAFRLIEQESPPADAGELAPFYAAYANLARATELLTEEEVAIGVEPKLRTIGSLALPITRILAPNHDPDQGLTFVATPVYGGVPFRAAFRLDASWSVEMLDDAKIPRVVMKTVETQWLGSRGRAA